MAKARKLEVCISNLDLGSQYVWDAVKEHFPEVRLKRWGCLGHCHRCIHVPYVLIDDSEYIEAETPEALWELVKAELSPKESFDTGGSRETEGEV